MKGLIIIIRKEKLDAVGKVLQSYNAAGMTVINVNGCSRHDARADRTDTESLRVLPDAKLEFTLLSKVRIETVVQDADVEPIIDALCDAAQTGKCGDGKIFIYDVIDSVRLRVKAAQKEIPT